MFVSIASVDSRQCNRPAIGEMAQLLLSAGGGPSDYFAIGT